MDQYYIQMADVIGSSEYKGQGRSLMRQFRAMVDHVNEVCKAHLLSPLSITLGDEFQGVPQDLSTAVGLIIKLEECRVFNQADFKLRHVIHYGEIETSINTESAHAMIGEGLSTARRTLNEMKPDRRTRCRLVLPDRDNPEPLMDAFSLYFSIVDSWKPKDFPLVIAMLEGLDYKQAAIKLKRERTSTLRRYRSLNFIEYGAAKRLLNYLSGGK